MLSRKNYISKLDPEYKKLFVRYNLTKKNSKNSKNSDISVPSWLDETPHDLGNPFEINDSKKLEKPKKPEKKPKKPEKNSNVKRRVELAREENRIARQKIEHEIWLDENPHDLGNPFEINDSKKLEKPKKPEKKPKKPEKPEKNSNVKRRAELAREENRIAREENRIARQKIDHEIKKQDFFRRVNNTKIKKKILERITEPFTHKQQKVYPLGGKKTRKRK